MLLSRFFYKCMYGSWNATSYGKTKRHFKVKVLIKGTSYLFGKKIKLGNNKLIAIQGHLLCYNSSPSFEDFSILTKESNDFKLQIAWGKLVLSKADSSLY